MRRRSMSVAWVVMLGLLMAPAVARGQRGDSLQVGGRVRVTLRDFPGRPGPQPIQGRWLSGELVARRADSLVLRPHPQTGEVAVPMSAVTRLERSRGTSRLGSGVEGAVGAAVVSAVLGWNLYERKLHGPGFNTRGQAIGTSAAVGGAIGLLVGILFPSERWKRVDVPTAR